MEKKRILQTDFIIIYCVAVVFSMVFSFIVTAKVNNDSNLYVYMLYLLPQLCYLVALTIFNITQNRQFRLLPEKGNIRLVNYLFAVLCGLGLFFFALLPNYGLQLLFAKLGLSPTVTVPKFDTTWDYIISGLIICVLPPIGEELIFRKTLCDGLNGIADWKIILISGAIFSLSHLNLAQTVHQFFIGCILAYVYIKTENITLTMLIHFINNLLALFITSVTGEAVWNSITTLIISCVAGIIVLSVGILMLYKKNPPLKKENTAKLSPFLLIFLAFITLLWIISAVMV